MTFNDNANVGGNTARRRGGGLAIGGGIAGIGAIAVLLLNLFTGSDLSSVIGPLTQGDSSTGEGTAIAECETGADANRSDDCRLAAASLALNQYWGQQLEDYREPGLVIVDGSTSTPCGTASNATGPFYCPPEETVYVDPTFFGILREQYGASAGALAQLYVLAHEYGHHVQQLIGVMDQYPNDGTGPDSNGVRTELQADCFAGAWVQGMASIEDDQGVPYLKAPTQDQIRDALNAAATVGDDHIQQESGGAVNPESWTHGSSDQRERWFSIGLEQGPGACDTFTISGGDL